MWDCGSRRCGWEGADGDPIDGTEGVVDLAQLGDVADGGVVEGEAAAIAELQDGDGGHGLGDRSPIVCSVCVDGLMGAAPRFSVEELGGWLAGADDSDGAPDDTVPGEYLVEALREGFRLG